MFIHNKFYILIRLSSFVEPESSTMCHVAVLSKFLSNNELNYVPILSQFYIDFISIFPITHTAAFT